MKVLEHGVAVEAWHCEQRCGGCDALLEVSEEDVTIETSMREEAIEISKEELATDPFFYNRFDGVGWRGDGTAYGVRKTLTKSLTFECPECGKQLTVSDRRVPVVIAKLEDQAKSES